MAVVCRRDFFYVATDHALATFQGLYRLDYTQVDRESLRKKNEIVEASQYLKGSTVTPCA